MIKRCVAGVISGLRLAVPLSLAGLSACVSTYSDSQAGAGGVGGAVQQPFRDISLMQENPPEILKRAASGPYQFSPASGCPEILAEIAGLDAVLGPDIDVPRADGQASGSGATSVVTDAIGGILSLPFRGVIRRMSGAEQRERELANAILAGMVRRGYLKGLLPSKDCAGAPPV